MQGVGHLRGRPERRRQRGDGAKPLRSRRKGAQGSGTARRSRELPPRAGGTRGGLRDLVEGGGWVSFMIAEEGEKEKFNIMPITSLLLILFAIHEKFNIFFIYLTCY